MGYGSSSPYWVAIGDVIGDAAPDIVSPDSPGMLNIRPGIGDGTFGAPISLPVTANVGHVVIGDFDGNELVDVAALWSDSVHVYLQSSAGSFDAPVHYAMTGNTGDLGLAVGRIDADMLPDLVCGSNWLKSNAGAPPDPPVAFGLVDESVATTGDLDGDGFDDVVTGHASGYQPILTVHRSAGDGTFDAPVPYATGAGPNAITLGDADGDGKTDVVTACYAFRQLVIHPGLGDGTLLTPPDVPMPGDPWQVALAEVTGDSHLDLLALVPSAGLVRLLPGHGDATFDAPVDLATPADPLRFALGDVDGDGIADLLTANGSSSNISVFPGTGTGFGGRSDYAMPATATDVTVADMDGDGIGDAVAVSRSGGNPGVVSIFPGQLSAGLGARADFGGSQAYPMRVFVGYTNADTIPDVEVASALEYSGAWSHFAGLGGGALGTPTSDMVLNTFYPTIGALGADFTDDGFLDLVMSGLSSIQTLTSNGDGTFTILPAQGPSGIESRGRGLVAGDLDGEPPLDLLTANWSASTVAVDIGNGTGSFKTERGYGSNGLPTDVALGDLDENGVDDAVVGNEYGASVSILLDASGATTAVTPAPERPHALAFSRVWPVPSRGGALHAAFVLPARGAAQLDLLDVAGRRVAGERLGVLEAGARSVTLALPRTLRPGVYWLRLTHGGRATATRVAVLR